MRISLSLGRGLGEKIFRLIEYFQEFEQFLFPFPWRLSLQQA